MTEASHQMTSNPLPEHGPHKPGEGPFHILHTHTHTHTGFSIYESKAASPPHLHAHACTYGVTAMDIIPLYR